MQNLDPAIYQPTLNKILENNRHYNQQQVKNIIVLLEEQLTHIGDWVIAFDKLKYLKSFFPNASVTVNFTAYNTTKIGGTLLKNNPYLDAVQFKQWKDIELTQYDLVFTYSYKEPKMLAWLHEKYGELIQQDQYPVCVFTFSHGLARNDPNAIPVFPVNQEFFAYVRDNNLPAELYITKEEQQWGNEWLKDNGLKEGEELYIVLDTTRRDKLISMPVLFQLVMHLLKIENAKFLVFDENNMGKEQLYAEVLGPKLMERFIFSKGLRFRQDLCLIGSSYTRLILGPCTGLMHCASSIFNNYVRNGLEKEKLPLLITYTGKYNPDERYVNYWWSNAPLVNILALRLRNNQKVMLLLEEMEDAEKKTNCGLPCSEYTVSMLTDFVDKKLLHNAVQV